MVWGMCQDTSGKLAGATFQALLSLSLTMANDRLVASFILESVFA